MSVPLVSSSSIINLDSQYMNDSMIPPTVPAVKVESAIPAPSKDQARGRSFNLRQSYGPNFSIGQMLAVHNSVCQHAPLEVVGCYFPLIKTLPRDVGQQRVALGAHDLKQKRAYIIEVRVEREGQAKYRLLYANSCKPVHSGNVWQAFVSENLTLKTTAEQRAAISAFTGVMIKSEQEHPAFTPAPVVKDPNPAESFVATMEELGDVLSRTLGGNR